MEEKLTYEKAVKRLEEIVKRIAGGDMDIDSLTANLKEAKGLVEFCKEKLTNVEAEVKKCLDM